MTEFDEGNLASVRRNLDNRHRELTKRLAQAELELSGSHSQDFADQAVEREQDEVLEGEERVFEIELAQIDAAIARLDAGTYGDCAKCGEPFAAARLAVQPEAPLCMNCAS